MFRKKVTLPSTKLKKVGKGRKGGKSSSPDNYDSNK